MSRLTLKITIPLVLLPILWLQAAFWPLAAPAFLHQSQLTSGGKSAWWAAGPQAGTRARSLTSDARSQIRQAISAVGLILVRSHQDPETRGPRPRGSGVVVRQDGIIVTNYHVVARDKSTELYDEIYLALPVDGVLNVAPPHLHRLNAVLVNRDQDLVLLRVAARTSGDAERSIAFPAVEIGDSRAIRELDDVVIIGYPEKGGSSVTVNLGTIEGKELLDNWIKTDARLIHGNSGGAAVDSEGRLIGIPTRVEVDRQPTDKDGDGFPDGFFTLGAVGFLRPAHLVRAMLEQIGEQKSLIADPRVTVPAMQFSISGVVKSALDGRPIAGAAVGLTPPGTQEVSVRDILTWAYTNPEGRFKLNRPVPPGHYTLQAKTFGYEVFRRDIQLGLDTPELTIELRRSEY
jgi:S1-C subfamily serine protease